MTIRDRPSTTASLAGGAIALEPNPCRHAPARRVSPWRGEPGTAGVVAVVGAGKMGLPLAAQFASHGWSVIPQRRLGMASTRTPHQQGSQGALRSVES
jgi:hypothetical protein